MIWGWIMTWRDPCAQYAWIQDAQLPRRYRILLLVNLTTDEVPMYEVIKTVEL